MIFLTVGTQVHFSRLARALDEWCATTDFKGVFGQLGNQEEGGYSPDNFAWTSFLTPDEYNRKMREADLIVAHAGMGSIITARTMSKPIVVMPRRSDLGEHRNDHQIATVAKLRKSPGVHVAMDEQEIAQHLDALCRTKRQVSPSEKALSPYAAEGLVNEVRRVVLRGAGPRRPWWPRSRFFGANANGLHDYE
ncbi:MAG: glycosyltransferase [Pseudomonadota bacterium]